MPVTYRLAALAALVLLALARPGLALPNEPRGFAGAQFGMRASEVQQLLPAMKPLPEGGSAGGAPLAFYTLDGQSLHGLGPCAVQLFFVQSRLYELTFDCGRTDAVEAALRTQFGPPTQQAPRGTFWFGERTAVTLNPKSHTFAFIDRALNQTAQTLLLQAVRSQPAPPAPPATRNAP